MNQPIYSSLESYEVGITTPDVEMRKTEKLGNLGIGTVY